jgi:hypothetical protein
MANEDATGATDRTLPLCVAFQAKVIVAFNEQFGVDGAVGIVTNGAAFAESFVFKNVGAGLLAMTLSAGFIEATHGEAARGFLDIAAVRIVTLDAIHFAFDDRVMLRESEFCVRLEMTIETPGGVVTRIDDKLSAATTSGDVLTAGTMTGFTAIFGELRLSIKAQARMRGGGEGASVFYVALGAGFITNKSGPFNGRRNEDGAFGRRARDERPSTRQKRESHEDGRRGPFQNQWQHDDERRKMSFRIRGGRLSSRSGIGSASH